MATDQPKVQFDAKEILKICHGEVIQGTLTEERGSICSDISLLRPGDWFLALPSDRSDGHDELGIATASGALGCIVLARRSYAFADPDALLIGVPSTLHALYMLAVAARETISPIVVGITGSSGKSTTKDMCRAILSQSYRTHATDQSCSTSKGLAANLLSMPLDTEVLVAEVSQRGRGQIAWLSAGLDPDIAIITNVGMAHLETLGTLENIAAAKCELLEGVNRDSGYAILGDSGKCLVERAAKVFNGGRCIIHDDTAIEEIAVTPETTVFSVSGSDVLFELHAHGSGYVRDAWCAIACARFLEMTDAKIAEGLRHYTPARGRGSRINGLGGALIIDETHSATPDSVRAAVTAFLDDRAVPHGRKFVVLSDMEELGEASGSIHSQLGTWLSERSFSALVTMGKEAEAILNGLSNPKFETYRCADAVQVMEILQKSLNPETAVLVDGSDSDELRLLIRSLLAAKVRQP
jgi:UDP-N-acetylmuramoyl-tripeptide--D-alanyl-D-alanine ligase